MLLPWRSALQHGRDLAEINDECALRQVSCLCADQACEDAVCQANCGLGSRNIGTYVGQEDYDGDLFCIAGLARHVWSCHYLRCTYPIYTELKISKKAQHSCKAWF